MIDGEGIPSRRGQILESMGYLRLQMAARTTIIPLESHVKTQNDESNALKTQSSTIKPKQHVLTPKKKHD